MDIIQHMSYSNLAQAYKKEADRSESMPKTPLYHYVPSVYSGHRMCRDVYHIEDGIGTSCYLLLGTAKALLLDTGMNPAPLLPWLRNYTHLPICLVATHAHPDHILHADEFETIYLGKDDLQLLSEVYSVPEEILPEGMPPFTEHFSRTSFHPVEDKARIASGEFDLEALSLAGHTPGSMLYIDHRHKYVFTGDAFGCGTPVGVWMFFRYCPVLSKYLANLKRIYDRLAELSDYVYLGGHLFQAFIETGRDVTIAPPGIEMLRDMITLCQKALAGELPHTKSSIPVKNAVRLQWKTAAMETLVEKIR